MWRGTDGAYDLTDPGFFWRGRFHADAAGHYAFETILPGRYLNGATYRPRHIHLKASHPGYAELTTQIYFEGDPFIPSDPFVRSSLVIPLGNVVGVLRGDFPIVLRAS